MVCSKHGKLFMVVFDGVGCGKYSLSLLPEPKGSKRWIKAAAFKWHASLPIPALFSIGFTKYVYLY